jgi:hypothetical protein
MLPNASLKEDDMQKIVNDLAVTSLAFRTFKELYFSSPYDSILRMLASEIEKVIKDGD